MSRHVRAEILTATCQGIFEYGFMRFCGEREIDGNDKTGMILSNVPHYYVVGVELHKVAK